MAYRQQAVGNVPCRSAVPTHRHGFRDDGGSAHERIRLEASASHLRPRARSHELSVGYHDDQLHDFGISVTRIDRHLDHDTARGSDDDAALQQQVCPGVQCVGDYQWFPERSLHRDERARVDHVFVPRRSGFGLRGDDLAAEGGPFGDADDRRRDRVVERVTRAVGVTDGPR